jgi:amidase
MYVHYPASEAISIKDKGQVLNAVSISEHWDQAMVRYKYQKMYFDYWNSLKVDAWILPSSEACSYIPYLQRHKSTYTTIINSLDIPAITVPVAKVDKVIDTIDKEFVPVSDTDKTVQDLYNPELYHNQPVCLQVATRRFEEEKAMALAKVIFKASNYKA